MIELLLAAQTAATAALAVFVIKLRRELYPMFATAGPTDHMLTPLMRLWIRSLNVLVLETPQFEASKTVIKNRWLTSEELFLKYSFRIYREAMDPSSRDFYKEWKAWMQGDDKYDCRVKKPRGLSRLYNKAIDVFCKEKKVQKKEVEIIPTWARKWRYKRMLEEARRRSRYKSSSYK
jgi:hypothetical protein